MNMVVILHITNPIHMKIPVRHLHKKIIVKTFFILILFLLLSNQKVLAQITTTNYEFKEYGFDSGATESASTTNYSFLGSAGQTSQGSLEFTNYKLGAGLTYVIKANVPPAPTFTNPGNTYDRLKFVIDTGGNPSDTTFAIAISSDNFTTTSYIQDDGTVGSTLGSEDWQTYTVWGGASGMFVTGLAQETTYKIKVKARQGNFTESEFGPETAGVATAIPSLTVGLDASTLTFSNLNASNSYTDNAKSTTITTSTNAYNGYLVNARTTQPLTYGSSTIPHYASPNSAPTSWSGYGFGYTTSDTSLTGGTANRFTSGGAKYAGFTDATSGDPVADHPGPVESAISSEQFTISYRVTTEASQKAGSYTTTVLYIVTPEY